MSDFQKFIAYCNSPAFTPQIMQDQFGQLVAPVPGLSKIEYISAQIYTQVGLNAADAVVEAENLLKELYSWKENQNNESATIINPE